MVRKWHDEITRMGFVNCRPTWFRLVQTRFRDLLQLVVYSHYCLGHIVVVLEPHYSTHKGAL